MRTHQSGAVDGRGRAMGPQVLGEKRAIIDVTKTSKRPLSRHRSTEKF